MSLLSDNDSATKSPSSEDAATLKPVRVRRLGVGAATVFGASILGTVMRFGLQIVLVRLLPGAGYGRFVLARQWGEMLAKLPDRGYALGSVRFLPRYFASADRSRHRGMLQRTIGGTFVRSLLVAAIGAAAAVLLDQSTAIVVGMTLTIAIAMAGILRAALQGSNAYLPATVLQEAGQPILMAAGLAGLWVLDILSVVSALGVVIGSWVVIALAHSVLLRRHTPDAVLDAQPIFETEEWTRSTRLLFVAQLGIGVVNISDVLIVGATVGALEAGVYAIATRIAAIGRIANAAVESMVSPQIAAAAQAPDPAASLVQPIVDRAIRISLGPSIIFAIAAIIAATPVLELIGKEFVGGRVVLIALVLGNLADAVSGPSGHVVSLIGSERIYSLIMVASAIVLVAVAIPAGLLFGIVGVAVARSGVNVLWNAALFQVARSQFGIWCLPSRRLLPGR